MRAAVRNRFDQWSYIGLEAALVAAATIRESFAAIQRHNPIAGRDSVHNCFHRKLCIHAVVLRLLGKL